VRMWGEATLMIGLILVLLVKHLPFRTKHWVCPKFYSNKLVEWKMGPQTCSFQPMIANSWKIDYIDLRKSKIWEDLGIQFQMTIFLTQYKILITGLWGSDHFNLSLTSITCHSLAKQGIFRHLHPIHIHERKAKDPKKIEKNNYSWWWGKLNKQNDRKQTKEVQLHEVLQMQPIVPLLESPMKLVDSKHIEHIHRSQKIGYILLSDMQKPKSFKIIPHKQCLICQINRS